jgi:dihydroorotate dehydrogenase
LFYDPFTCKKINAGIADYLRANNLADIRQLVGSLRIGE